MTTPATVERRKPLDFGRDGVTGCVDDHGGLIALNSYHPVHGYVTLTTAEPFSERERYQPDAVRAYRRSLPTLHGAGLRFETPVSDSAFAQDSSAPLVPTLRLELADGSAATVATFACDGGACQLWTLPDGATPRWEGRISLQRAAYTQLTEGGPLPPMPVQSVVDLRDGVLTVENPALGWAVAVGGFVAAQTLSQREDGPVTLSIPVACDGGQCALTFAFGPDAATAAARVRLISAATPAALLDAERDRAAAALAPAPDDALLRRAYAYGVMLATPVQGESTCILTDHMLLPLSWNRDAYYVARMLLSWPAAAEAARGIVRRHLLWMFETAERIGGAWGRSYLANGRVKDAAYQLDQQVWPLLELADYIEATGDTGLCDRLREQVSDVLALMMAHKAPYALLFPTDETSADDPMTLPYPLSSHILLWRAAVRLDALGFGGWGELARDLPETIRQFFVAEADGRALYAYATDGNGQFRLYHDANDFPLVLAPAWDFTPADDPVWRATVDFAWSAANVGGCYGGRLGSVHTPAAWPLGDVQEWIVAQATGDDARAERARARLAAAAYWDGALPEAVDPTTDKVVSRTWFAWPNAAYACVALGAFGR